MIYVERPVFALFPLALLLWQVLVFVLRKHVRFPSLVDTLLTGVGLVGHAAAVSVILLGGGALSDALLLVLGSGTLALALSPKPLTADETKGEKR